VQLPLNGQWLDESQAIVTVLPSGEAIDRGRSEQWLCPSLPLHRLEPGVEFRDSALISGDRMHCHQFSDWKLIRHGKFARSVAMPVIARLDSVRAPTFNWQIWAML
jgi:hypothetical protein